MNVLITGANGFIGKHLQKLLLNNKNIKLFLLLRDKKKNNKNDANIFYADFEKKIIDWDIFLKNIDVVIHLAARQHKMGYKNDSNKYNQINSDLVKEIIERSEANNVKKFIYLSSARVYEELLHPFKSYSVSDKINPIDLYSKSKYSGEIELNKKIKENKIQIYILRIPLVYGGNPKGYLSLFNNLNKFNIPLPIKCFKDNLRSFLSIYNLVYFIEYLIFFDKNYSGTYLLCDAKDLSTYEFLKRYSNISNTKSTFIYLPKFILKIILSILLKKNIYIKLNNSLRINPTDTFQKFNWYSKFSIEDTIKKYFDER